jgi:TRAP-type mannitol/chloroaromatic compound transport system substrate-binding protein
LLPFPSRRERFLPAFLIAKRHGRRRVKIAKFDDSLLNTIHGISKDVVAEIGSRDELSKKIYASYLQFRNLIADWGEISGRYLSSRSTA